ncbi:GMC oxidoreductase, partial [Phellopilus nigrolimitatus]
MLIAPLAQKEQISLARKEQVAMTSSVDDVANKSFEYIIIGGGTAGLTVAARLSEDPSISVAVIEAGSAKFKDPLIAIPAQQGKFVGKPDYDWFLQTTPQTHANNKQRFLPRGKTLGGSSAVNFFAWNKPSAQDIDAWGKLGNPGWNWDKFAYYCKKAETFNLPASAAGQKFKKLYHLDSLGTSGPVQLTVPESIMAAEADILESLVNAGVPVAKDPFNGDPVGTYLAPTSIDPKTFTRSDAFTAYYLPNKGRPNLKVLCDALVHRIIEEPGEPGEKFKASGVAFEYDGRVLSVNAKKDVIVSAGALKSPQILELSGIGDREILQHLGIKTVVDLPGVGANMQEHIGSFTTFKLDPKHGSETLDVLDDEKIAAEQLALHSEGKGIHCRGITHFAMLPLSAVTFTPEESQKLIARQRARIQEKFEAGNLLPGLKEQYELQLAEYESGKSGNCEIAVFPKCYIPGMAEKGKLYFTVVCANNHTFSRGTIHVKSLDPHVQPEIDPHYLEDEFDLDVITESLKFARRLDSVEPFKSLIVKEVVPGPSVKTEEALREHVKATVTTIFHTTSTLSMVPREHNGVVDSKLRVYGTKNVRVVDLSIVPLNVAAHI